MTILAPFLGWFAATLVLFTLWAWLAFCRRYRLALAVVFVMAAVHVTALDRIGVAGLEAIFGAVT